MFSVFCAESVCTNLELAYISAFAIFWLLFHVFVVWLQEETDIGNQIVAFIVGFLLTLGLFGWLWVFAMYPITKVISALFVIGWIVSTLTIRRKQ